MCSQTSRKYYLILSEDLVFSRLGLVGEKTKGSKGLRPRFLLVVLSGYLDRLCRGKDVGLGVMVGCNVPVWLFLFWDWT